VTEHLMARSGTDLKMAKLRDVEFNPGDRVLVKLQPYRQLTLAKRLSNKLAKRYYGPFEVLERVGKVAYRLALPLTSKIHLVFHVSILKLFSGTGQQIVAELLEEDHEGHPLEQPLAIYDTRLVLRNEVPLRQVLVQWIGSSPEEATWEWLSEFQATYPSYHLEDKVIFKGVGNVTPESTEPNVEEYVEPESTEPNADEPTEPNAEPRPKRATSRPIWHKDYIM
ncbi:ty3-gypsy retrotransposon protein, partial [Tanacetum coccineum]